MSTTSGSLLAVEALGVAGLADAVFVTEDGLAVAILDTVDQRRLDLLAAIGEHGIGRNHAHDRGFTGAQRHGEERVHLVIDAETLGIFGNEVHAHVIGEAKPSSGFVTFRYPGAESAASRTAAVVLRTPTWPPETNSTGASMMTEAGV